MNTLIVDDQEENRYLLEALLKGNGHDVQSVANGAEALQRLKPGGIDLIISDILMPVMDGFELCRKVKSDESLRHIPFIVYTATYTGPQDEAFAFKIGADRFIQKPCEPDVFMEAIRDVMTSARRVDIASTPQHEEEIFKLYNERLVRKLEQKMLQLEKEVQMRKEADETLRESREKYKSILDNIEDGYYEVDLAGNLTFFNHSTCRILGYSSAELMGMNYREYMNTENAEKVFQTFHRVFTTGEPSRAVDWEIITKDGARHLDTSVSLIRNAEGNAIGFRGVARDVTEHRNAEKENIRLMKQLQQAQKLESIGRLAGGVDHDFNNLLSVILGYGELLLESMDRNHPHHESLELIYQAGIRARELTRQLLAFSRKQVLEMQIVDINSVAAGFEKLLQRMIGEDIQLNLALTAMPLTVRADTAQLEQVLMNLAVNARDAMPDGGILTIETAVVELDSAYAEKKPGVSPGSYAMISVSDTGCGMTKDTLDRIFEPFFTTKDREKGTGLGLATSYGIIKQHEGNIWVYSEPDKGTVFKIYLPLCVEKNEVKVLPSKLSPPVTASATVLIVEDDPSVRKLAGLILSGHGYTVIESNNVTDAIAKAAALSGPIHLVLTDVVMPQMKGPEVFDKIREHHPNARVLYMSGYTDNMIACHGVLNQGVQFIQKPFTAQGLLEKCRKVIFNIDTNL